MKQTVRWGIFGPGSISGVFAVEYGVPNLHGSHEALASDSEVDAVYVGTPHSFHEEHTLLCLQHGKHVLCEKPFAINAEQARRMIQRARDEDRLLMETMDIIRNQWDLKYPME